jgi:hypothetical protein
MISSRLLPICRNPSSPFRRCVGYDILSMGRRDYTLVIEINMIYYL